MVKLNPSPRLRYNSETTVAQISVVFLFLFWKWHGKTDSTDVFFFSGLTFISITPSPKNRSYKALMSSLTELALEGNEFVDTDLAALLLSLATNQTLVTLKLDKSVPSRSAGREETMSAMSNLLESDQSRLQVLSVADCRLKRGASALLQSLSDNDQLHTLDISGNSMGDTGASSLAALLHHNRTLRTIRWDNNLTTSQGLREVGAALRYNPSVLEMPLPLFDIAHSLKTTPVRRKLSFF